MVVFKSLLQNSFQKTHVFHDEIVFAKLKCWGNLHLHLVVSFLLYNLKIKWICKYYFFANISASCFFHYFDITRIQFFIYHSYFQTFPMNHCQRDSENMYSKYLLLTNICVNLSYLS